MYIVQCNLLATVVFPSFEKLRGALESKYCSIMSAYTAYVLSRLETVNSSYIVDSKTHCSILEQNTSELINVLAIKCTPACTCTCAYIYVPLLCHEKA